MYIQKAKVISVVVGVLLVIGAIAYQAIQIEKLEETVAKSNEDIQKLEEKQIISMDENKALSTELDELESTHLESLEEIRTFEEQMTEKDGQIEQLEEDLISKKEKEEEQRLAKIEEEKQAETAKVQQVNSDKSTVSSKDSDTQESSKSVSTASSSRSAIGDYTVTYYSAYDGTQSGITRGGTNMANGNIHTSDGYRIIASDLSVIPLGTIVRVTTGNGETFMAKVDDSGGAIVGNKIDIAVSSPEEAFRLGRTTAKVEIVN